jgi:hypothetical protein
MALTDQMSAQLAPVLLPGEIILDATTGRIQVTRMGSGTQRNGIVAVTDRRVILFTKKMGGYDVQDFAFGLLTSVDHKKGMIWGNLDLAAAGDRTGVEMVNKNEVERIAQTIRHRMAAAHAQPPPAPHPVDVAAQIRDLAKLRDEGLVTPEEFEAKKRLLLGL